MRYEKVLLGMMFVLLLVPAVCSIDVLTSITWEKSCLNTTHLYKDTGDFYVNLDSNSMNDTIYCPYGCEENVDKYGADCVDSANNSSVFVSLGFYVLFEIFAFVFIVLAIYDRKIWFSMFAMILFFMLALLSVNVTMVYAVNEITLLMLFNVSFGLLAFLISVWIYLYEAGKGLSGQPTGFEPT